MYHRGNISGGDYAYSFCCLFKPFFNALTVGASAHGLQNANGGVFINVFSHCQPSYSMLLSLFQVDM
jgi:hypothetical protein